ncbi:MAG TPA: hypothetical protein VLZ75_02755 [Chitinophagales bacterium]|nr:hypothetical protein [Chitinophagales bacterium]
MKHQISTILLIFLCFCVQNILSAQEQEYKTIKIEEVEEDTTIYKSNDNSDVAKSVSKKEDKKWDWSQFRVGGNLGLSFGSYTYVEVSPTVGYWIIPEKLQIGVSTKFIYQSFKYNNGDKYKSFVYGGGVFADYVIWRGLFAHGEFELINKDSYFSNKRVNVPSLLLGGGYIQTMGNAGHFYIAALFDVLDSDESLNTGTFGDFPLILRVGFGFGFPGANRK